MAGMAGIRLRGLQAAAHLNGQLGICKGYDESNARWLIQLESGEEKAVKNDNILQILDPGTDITLNGGKVLHVTVGRVSIYNQMETGDRDELLSDLEQMGTLHNVRAEVNCPDGWPQMSVVLTGEDPESVKAARQELCPLLQHYGMVIGKASTEKDAAEKKETEEKEPETVEVEGMVMKSMERRERPSRKR
eukprot:TRINITY_DN15464_c1_g1_i1.p1 TRINITY_DN15464_c1_g1~~TRINITY_DN15464_c1_g1_i1.p1  ORF type:complete len:191 (-),score=51.79 TRINITY_DN15464_c1_g1_i1:288-860(-)